MKKIRFICIVVLSALLLVVMLLAVSEKYGNYETSMDETDALRIAKIILEDAKSRSDDIPVPSVLYSDVLSKNKLFVVVKREEGGNQLCDILDNHFAMDSRGIYKDSYGNVVVMIVDCYNSSDLGIRFELYSTVEDYEKISAPVHVTKKFKSY